MPDLRDMLQQAAGAPPDNVPLDDIRSRGRSLVHRRRVVAMVVVVVALLAGVAVAIRPPGSATPATDTPRPLTSVGEVTPGTYRANLRDLSVTLEVPSDAQWWTNLLTSHGLVLARATPEAVVSIEPWKRAYEPQGSGPMSVAPVPDDLMAWLSDHPLLFTEDSPRAVRVGDRPAHRITVSVDPRRVLPSGPLVGCSSAADCVPVAETPDNPVVVRPGELLTVIVFDGDPDGLIVTVVQPLTSLLDDLPLVDSLTFG
jgi:hypothetical protein